MSQDIVKRISKARLCWAFVFFAFSLTACTNLSSRLDSADQIIKGSALQTQTLPSRPLPLFMASNTERYNLNAGDSLTVVIEGDGYSWINRNTLSDNPTPLDPVGLKIIASLQKPAVYLARPCQYISPAACRPALWADERFGPDVLASTAQAFDRLKHQYGARHFELIGFSGGAYIALMLAAQRDDIIKVTTIGGVLDPQSWTEYHAVAPLHLPATTDALAQNSRTVQFTHICSDHDEIMPCSLTRDFIAHAQTLGLNNHKIIVIPKAGHTDLWQKTAL